MPIQTVRNWFTKEEEEEDWRKGTRLQAVPGLSPSTSTAPKPRVQGIVLPGQGKGGAPMPSNQTFSLDEIQAGMHTSQPREFNIWQSWSRDWEDMGKLEKVFSLLNRGQHASANVTWALLQGKGDLATAAWSGLTSRERGDYVDILRHYDMPWAPVLGTILNIGLDPTTYLTGPLTLFKRGAKVVGQQKAVAQAVSMITESNAAKLLNNMFNVHANIPKILGEEKFMKLHQMTTSQDNWLKKLEGIYNGMDKTMMEEIHTLVELSGEIKVGQGSKYYEDVHQAIMMFQELGQEAVRLKLITPEALKKQNYVPRLNKKLLNSGSNPTQDILGPLRTPFFGIDRRSNIDTAGMRRISDMYLDIAGKSSKEEMITTARRYIQEYAEAEGVRKNLTAPATEELMESLQSIFMHKRGGDMKFVSRTVRDIADGWAPVEDIHTALGLYGLELIKAQKKREFKNYVLRSADASGWATKWDGGVVPRDQQLWMETGALRDWADNIRHALKSGGLEEFGGFTEKTFEPIWESITRSRVGAFDDLARLDDQALFRAFKHLKPDVDIWRIDQGVADHLSRASDLFEGRTKETGQLLRLYDKMVQPWKKWATIMRMPFHVRNAISNTARAYMAGVSPFNMPGLAAKASQIQMESTSLIEIAGTKMSGHDWLQEMSNRGVRGWGYLNEAIGHSHLQRAREVLAGEETTSMALKVWQAPETLGKFIGLAIEDNSRIMVALDRFSKNANLGDTATRLDDAAKHSWKYLFQYDQLTAFEQGVMKRVFPFYTWMRKNVPLQVEDLLNQPGRTSRMSKTYNALRYFDSDRPEHEGVIPEYMRDFGHLKVPDGVRDWFSSKLGTKVPDSLYVHIDLPWGDLVNITQPVKTLLNALSPAALPLQLGLNVKSFPEPGPIERWGGELKAAPWPVSWLPEFAWPLIGIQPIRDRDTGKQILGMPAKAEFALTSLIPVISELNRLHPQHAELEPEDAPWRKVRYVTALNFTPINSHEQNRWWLLERKKKLGEATRLASQLGRGLTVEEMDRILGRHKSY